LCGRVRSASGAVSADEEASRHLYTLGRAKANRRPPLPFKLPPCCLTSWCTRRYMPTTHSCRPSRCRRPERTHHRKARAAKEGAIAISSDGLLSLRQLPTTFPHQRASPTCRRTCLSPSPSQYPQLFMQYPRRYESPTMNAGLHHQREGRHFAVKASKHLMRGMPATLLAAQPYLSKLEQARLGTHAANPHGTWQSHKPNTCGTTRHGLAAPGLTRFRRPPRWPSTCRQGLQRTSHEKLGAKADRRM